MPKLDLSTAIEMVACSDAGRVRRNNEDAVFANARLGIAVLADGMGGHNAGEVASGMATTALGSELEHAFKKQPAHQSTHNGSRAREVMLNVIARTNAAIHMAARSNPKFAGMGTTLVAVQFYDNRLVVAHVGDSRLYRFRGDTLSQLTRDHSLLQEQIDSGMLSPEQARFAPNKNLVTRALGVDSTVKTEVGEHESLPGDIYLLCSDGLNDMAEDREIEALLTAMSSNLSLCAQQLIQMANEHGGRDNVSVILARVREPFPAARSVVA
jgi:PPM family protein phosphatase